MAERHTQGRLTYREDGEWLVSLLQNGQQLPHTDDEKLRRLAACWNYCEGLDTEGIECSVDIDRPAKVVLDEFIKKELDLVFQRVQLLEALTELMGPYADNPCAHSGLMDLTVTGEDINNARAAIANANANGSIESSQNAYYKAGFRAGMEYQESVEVDLLEALTRVMDLDCPLTGNPTHAELVEHWEYEKTQGRGEADDRLFALAAIAKATGGAA